MIIRRETSGLHLYDRESGLHCLLDEVKVPSQDAELCGPRHLSLMLTNRCNCRCDYCYAIKGNEDISPYFLQQVCIAANELQILDLTLGGGEPTLHPEFVQLVKFIWDNYEFGVSVTTNGFDENILKEVMGKLSKLWISLDSLEKKLTKARKAVVARLNQHFSLGINLLYPAGGANWAHRTVHDLLDIGVRDVLVIPEHDKGSFILSDKDWQELGILLQENCGTHFMITEDAHKLVDIGTLSTSHEREFLFAHIDADGYIRNRSWGPAIAKASCVEEIVFQIRQQNPIRRNSNESVD